MTVLVARVRKKYDCFAVKVTGHHRNPESGIRNPKQESATGIQNLETGIRNLQIKERDLSKKARKLFSIAFACKKYEF